MSATAVITTKCRVGTPYRDYFCLCRTLAPLRPYGAAADPETTLAASCGCIQLPDDHLRVTVVDPGCDRHRTGTR